MDNEDEYRRRLRNFRIQLTYESVLIIMAVTLHIVISAKTDGVCDLFSYPGSVFFNSAALGFFIGLLTLKFNFYPSFFVGLLICDIGGIYFLITGV